VTSKLIANLINAMIHSPINHRLLCTTSAHVCETESTIGKTEIKTHSYKL